MTTTGGTSFGKPWGRILVLLMTGFLRGHCVSSLITARRLSARKLLRSTSSLHASSSPPQKIAIVGGGLAGLSTAFHLLESRSQQEGHSSSPFHITIMDKEEVGLGGASAVAGGLVHPLTPRGKLAHWGREGLQATNRLVDRACQSSNSNNNVVLRSEIFRIATSDKQAKQLQEATQNDQLKDICEWMEPHRLADRLHLEETPSAFGGLRLFNGCKVLHLPSYLKGLWAACQQFSDPTVSVEWKQHDCQHQALDEYDTVVWAAGSGLFEESGDASNPIPSLPVHLVRGQSVEVRLPPTTSPTEALLSGKYISPLPEPDRVLVGATHEFQPEPMEHSQVKQLLQEKTEAFAPPHVWTEDAVVERTTTGTRVQSQRGSQGRLPIVGKLDDRHWIFTGLSSRGLLYHAVYGKVLAQAILEGSEQCLESECYDYDWWRRK